MLTIKNRYIVGLGQWLMGLTLDGRESRERTKFIETLSEQLKENEAVRFELIKKYAEMDGDTPKVVEEKGTSHYIIPDADIPKFNKEINDYLDEDFSIGGPGNKARLKIIKGIVLDTKEKISPDIAPDYDKWCEAFELMADE